MRIFSDFKGVKGFVTLWERVIRFRYMITEDAKRRTEILAFWEKYGTKATEDAFKIRERTLFRWQKALLEGGGKLESLNKKSTAPKKKNKRVIPENIKALILKEREFDPRISKDKLAVLIKEDGIGNQCASTVGRMLNDMKQRGELPYKIKYSLYGKTGNLIEKKPHKFKKKLRSKGYEGMLVKADSIIRFHNGVKRYIVTALDTKTKFAFSFAYVSHSSDTTADFMAIFRKVSPVPVTHIQTDNGSEFADHFEMYIEKNGLTHFHTYPRSPKMNSEIERFNRTLSDAFISRNKHLLAYDIDEFNRKMMEWLLWYNTRRPHWSLGLVSPLRYIVSTLSTWDCQMLWTDTYI